MPIYLFTHSTNMYYGPIMCWAFFRARDTIIKQNPFRYRTYILVVKTEGKQTSKYMV